MILREIDENLIKASSGREALEHLLKIEIAVVLMDVCMPELDGFELAAMIREHPRFRKTAIIFISAIHLTDMDRLRGYEMGAVDYVPVPVIPEVLRAKVRVFAELYRKSRQLEQLNAELERRVADRTAELERSTRRLQQSEDRRNLALAAGKMGSWDWDLVHGDCVWDEGQKRIFGVDPESFEVTLANCSGAGSSRRLENCCAGRSSRPGRMPAPIRSNSAFAVPMAGCDGASARPRRARTPANQITRISGVTIDITDRKEAEERQLLLAREVDHRAKNALAVVHAIICADPGRQHQAVRRRRRRPHPGARAGAQPAFRIRAGAAPTSPNSSTRNWRPIARRISIGSGSPATSLSLEPSDRAGARAGAPRTRHQRRQIWRVVGAVRRRSGRLGLEGRPTRVCTGPKAAVRRSKRRDQADSAFASSRRASRASWAAPSNSIGVARGFRAPSPSRIRFDWSFLEILGRRTRTGARWRPVQSGWAPRKRILLVEDESLIAMMMEQTLRGLDFEVVGPFGSVHETLAAIESEPIDAGILDINLGGEMVYPIARILQARKVPFVFMTGYGAETIAAAFPDVRILQKPIEREMLQQLFVTEVREPQPARAACT